MINLGIHGDDLAAYEAALRSTHVVRVTVDVTTLDGAVLSSINPVLLDGSVTVDATADVSRSASLTFLDPNHALNFDTDAPDDGALYADRMLRIRYGVQVEALGKWIDATVFWGPVTMLERQGDTVNVEAQGKEALASGAIWRTMVLKKGQKITDAIRTLMKERAGETSFSIPEADSGKEPRLHARQNLDRTAIVWDVARKLARSMNRQIFYSGDGRLVVRQRPTGYVYTFSDGDGGDVLSAPQVSYDLSAVKNVVHVIGKKPKGAKERIRYTAKAPAGHPLSPERLGRTNAPRFLVEEIDDDSIGTAKAAKERAEDRLDALLTEPVTVTFDSLPIPHLDPGDPIRLKTDDYTTTFTLQQFSLPLTPGGSMSVGYLKKTTPRKKRIRR